MAFVAMPGRPLSVHGLCAGRPPVQSAQFPCASRSGSAFTAYSGSSAAGEGSARTGLWIAALTIEYLGPASFFRVPGSAVRRSRIGTLRPSYRERCGLFVIIALGESVLITGATFAEMAWTAVPLAAFAVSLIGSIAMWWL